MRHVFGFLLGLVLAAGALAATTTGIYYSYQDEVDDRSVPLGLVLVVVAALVLGVAAVLRRWSPVVPFLAGAAFVAVGVLLLVLPDLGSDLDLPDVFTEPLRRDQPWVLFLLVGTPLLLLSLVPQGRRPRRDRGDDGRDDDGFTAVPSSTPEAWQPQSDSSFPATRAYPAAEPYRPGSTSS